MLNSPFLKAGATRSLSNGLLKGSKLSFNGILTNLEKTVSTINQVVPLYNQVKPLISNSKTLINAFKSTRNNTSNKPYKNRAQNNQNVINVNIEDNKLKSNEKKDLNDVFMDTNTPNKPYFN